MFRKNPEMKYLSNLEFCTWVICSHLMHGVAYPACNRPSVTITLLNIFFFFFLFLFFFAFALFFSVSFGFLGLACNGWVYS